MPRAALGDLAFDAAALPAPSAPPGDAPVVRTPLAVVVSRFPVVTETFILREIAELERQGQPVVLVPLIRERPPVVHPEARPWVARALYTPFLSAEVMAAVLRALRRRPRAFLRLLSRLLRGNAGNPGMALRTLALFPKSVLLAERLGRAGVGHVHAHFATHPATAAYVIQELAGIPYSISAHAHDIFVRRDMLEAKLDGARFVRCVSEFNRRFLRERYPRQADRLSVVHVGVPPARARTQPAQAARILCVAAFKPYKGHAVLLEACARLRGAGVVFTCDLVGDGPLRASVEDAVRAAGLGGHVRVLGARDEGEVAALMATATVVVQASVVAADGQMEGIPVALMEAMAAGKPVVASALSGIPELAEDGVSGLLVPPGDAEALAAALARVLREAALGAWLGERGRRQVTREFDLAATAAEVLELVDRHRPAAAPEWPERLRRAGLGPVVGLRSVHETPDSSAAAVLVSGADGAARGGTRELVVKVHRGDAEAAGRAAGREFRTLAALHEQLRGAAEDGRRLATPAPLRLDEAAGMVVMEACSGEPLSERMRRLRWQRSVEHAAVLRDLRATGSWLRAFQERTAGAATAVSVDALVAAAEEDGAQAALGGAREARIRRRLRELRMGVRAEPLAPTGHHGDLWPGNVFVADDAVTVLDLEGFRWGLAEEDAAYFLVQARLFYSYPPLWRRRRAITAAFFDGYLGGRRPDPALWALCWTAKVLQVLARTRAAAVRGRWRTRWRRHALLNMLEAQP